MFLHGGFGHFLGNMWSLYIFGDNIETLAETRKLVTPAAGLRRRTFRVAVPPGIRAGKSLRLKGLGKVRPMGPRRSNLTIELVSL